MMSIILYQKDIESLLQVTAHFPFIARLSALPIIGKHFECSDIILFRQKLKQAIDDRKVLTVEPEDVQVLVKITYSAAKVGRVGESVFSVSSPQTTVCQKIVDKLYKEYPEYFEEPDANN